MYLPQTKNKIQMVLGQVSDYIYIYIYIYVYTINILYYITSVS